MIEKIMKREISGIEYTLTLKNIKNKYLRIDKDGNISVSAGIIFFGKESVKPLFFCILLFGVYAFLLVRDKSQRSATAAGGFC